MIHVKHAVKELESLSLDELLPHLIGADHLDAIIEAAKREDLGERGDITSQVFISERRHGIAQIQTRHDGVLAGAAILPAIARCFDPHLLLSVYGRDGQRIERGDVVASISGPLRGILACERTMLNFLCHLSGIATTTHKFVEAVAGHDCRIYDTRKTLPGLRALDKYAVRCGGGYCHRIGLFDAVLIKDNHLAHLEVDQWIDAIRKAITTARAMDPPPAFIEVEVDSLDQLDLVLHTDVDMVLLDNMSPQELHEAVTMRDARAPDVELEASGGVTYESVRRIAETGVDRIAIGSITHSAPALDIGLDVLVD